MRRSLRNQKKQTRLAFQSLPTSSPAKNDYDPAIQDRLARVTYSGAKRRPLETKHVPIASRSSTLPTPEPSSAIKADAHSMLKPVGLVGQMMLTRRPDPTSPLSSLPTSPSLPPRFAAESPVHAAIHSESEDEDDILLPSSKRRRLAPIEGSLSTQPKQSRGRLSGSLASSPLSKYKERLPASRRVSARQQQPFVGKDDRLSDHTSEAQKESFSTRTLDGSKAVLDIGSAETSGDEDDVIVTRPRKARRSGTKLGQPDRNDDAFVVNDDEVEYISSDHDAAPTRHQQQLRKADTNDFLVDDDVVEYLTSDAEAGSERRYTKQNRDRQQPKTPRRRSRREQEELEEDLLDLQDSDQESTARKSRTRGGPVTTQRDRTREHLARLKQRRAGKGIPRVIDSDEEDEFDDPDDYAGVDIDNITQEQPQDDILSDDNSQSSALSLIGAPDPGNEQLFVEDEDDFIVEDSQTANTGRHGRPHPDVPLEFTSFASAKPKDLFIHIIEWMVKNKISPVFQREDPLYDLAFNRVDDQVKAQAGSRLISAAWNAKFKYAILARPIMTIEALPGLDEDWIRRCDACNRTNHPARYDFKFSGQAYHNDTLEPVEDDDEDDERNEDNSAGEHEDDVVETMSRASRDAQGHALSAKSTHFYLGRYCAAAAEMGHKLSHWKHHLNDTVLSYLESQDVLSAASILAREKLNKKKREREAEAIVDTMNDTGVVSQLWQGFQDDLEDARWGMEGYEGTGKKGGKTRSKHRVGSVRVSGASGLDGKNIGEWIEGGRFRTIPATQSDSEGD